MPIVNFPVEYVPDVVQSFEQVTAELLRIQAAMQDLSLRSAAFRQWFAAPARPFDGMVVYADGATWNPGAGKGIYRYDGAAWNLLG